MHSVGDREGLLLGLPGVEMTEVEAHITASVLVCYNHQWQVAHGQYKFQSRRWLKAVASGR